MAQSLSDRLERGILETVRASSPGYLDIDFNGWVAQLRPGTSRFGNGDLVDAFIRSWRSGWILLSKFVDHERPRLSYLDGGAVDSFFNKGSVGAALTPEGRKALDQMGPSKQGVFISHSKRDAPVANRLKRLIADVLGQGVPVFVSSDGSSIRGGELWRDSVLTNLDKAAVVLVLLSLESQQRPWINFEAGWGRGQGAAFIPIVLPDLAGGDPIDPLGAFQSVTLDSLDASLDRLSEELGVARLEADVDGASSDMRTAFLARPAPDVRLEIEPHRDGRKWECRFSLVNDGSLLVRPIEVKIWIASALLACPYDPSRDRAILKASTVSQDGVEYTEISYRNDLEPRSVQPGLEPLVKELAARMTRELKHVKLEINGQPLQSSLSLRYSIFFRDGAPLTGTINLADKLR